jgi:hypothetical protein
VFAVSWFVHEEETRGTQHFALSLKGKLEVNGRVNKTCQVAQLGKPKLKLSL